MGIQGHWASGKLVSLESSWDRLKQVIDCLGAEGLDRRIRDGWTVKEMLAHLAFWEETSLPVVGSIFRGGTEIPVEEWYGGTDLEIAPGAPWPNADTHNEREARWAKIHSNSEVLDRLFRARQQLISVISSVTDEEGNTQIGSHLTDLCNHTDSHIMELETIANSVKS